MSHYPGADPSWGGSPQPGTTPGQPVGGQGVPPGYQQGYPQQAYPQQGYAQPFAPYPAPTYPQQQGYQGQPGYPSQPGYTAPGYAAPAPNYTAPNYTAPGYGYQPQAYPTAVAAPSVVRSPVLGYVSLAIVVLATLGCLAGGWMLLQAVQELYLASVYTASPSSDELQQAMVGPFGVIGIAGTVGFAGWVAGIVATATNRGRVAGILAIIVGVLAPILTWGYVALSFADLVQRYR